MAIQYIGVMESGVKSVITPTKLKLSVFLKIDDITISSFKGLEDDSCYLFAFLNRWKFYDIHLKSNIFGKL